ncbi:MAG TPA: PadR family transcriptional regulator [Candidatus Agrococcus pullicola]|uniref:PadR family transcriptional regulator n=1 Tax=Candidatus Agrococcus pullicola TaxID=2838429 RepID=A0A9D1YUE1_9MICO|nr:PadR family transcriptional regulator [Candidatus Agrococcus pullicola]
MAHVILGLLMLWPQSLYDLTKHFEAGVSLFYSASTGSIKRALDRLLSEGWIAVESASGPRGKKTYSISDEGRTEFRRWMLVEANGGDPETAILARTFFLGLLQGEDRSVAAARIHDRIRQDLARLEQLDSQLPSTAVPEGFEEVAHYQLATLQYGIATGRTALRWAEEYLPEE